MHIHNVYHIIGNEVYDLLALKNIAIVQTLHNFRFLCPAGLHIDNNYQICEKCSNGNFSSCFIKKCYQNSYFKSFIMKEFVQRGRAKVLKNVTIFIALNDFYRRKFIEGGFQKEKIFIKPNFLNQKNEIATNSKKYALFIGRISPEKGVECLIKSFENIPFKLKIAGTGSDKYFSSLKELAKTNLNIEFLGYVSGISKAELIKSCSFLVIPSIWYEAFGLVGLEAYSFGKPILASNIGGLPDIVIHNQTGLLVEPGNIEAWAEAIKSIIKEEKYIELGANGYEFFMENFTEKQNYPQLMAIYEKAIALNINAIV